MPAAKPHDMRAKPHELRDLGLDPGPRDAGTQRWRSGLLSTPSAVVLILGLLAALGVYWGLREHERQRIVGEVRYDAVRSAALLENQIFSHEFAVASLGGLFRSSQQVNQEEFSLFARQLLDSHPNLQNLVWIAPVSAADRKAFEQDLCRRGFDPCFISVEVADGKYAPSPPKPIYYPAVFAETRNFATRPVGFDHGSMAERLAAIQGIRPGASVQSQQLPTRANRQGELRTFHAAPVYSPRDPTSLMGIAVSVIDVAALGMLAVASLEPSAHLYLRDSSGPGPPTVIADLARGAVKAHQDDTHDESRATEIVPLQLAGRSWELAYRVLPQYIDSQRTGFPLLALILCLLGTGLVAMWVDVPRRRLIAAKRIQAGLERAVADRTAELSSANRELDAFAYSVSHDLRAPLRAIDGFSSALAEDFADSLPEGAQAHLARVRRGAQTMGALIDDLLAFSRASRLDLKRGHVDVRALVEHELELLRHSEPSRDVKVSIGELASCRADPALLALVWRNLLSNAFKYTRFVPHARVEISSLVDPQGVPCYLVRDNGVGFDMAYAGKLFGVFQRLHGPDEFEGTGVGLAIAARIIARHGGTISANAKPDEGAEFRFSLPAENAA